MITDNIMLVGIVAGIASVTGFIAYLPLLFNRLNLLVKFSNIYIILVNTLIGLSIIAFGFGIFLAFKNGSSLIASFRPNLPLPIFYVNASLVAIFSVFQFFYLFSRNTLLEEESKTIQQEKIALSTSIASLFPISDEDIEERLREAIRSDLNTLSLRILDMSFPLSTTKLYIPTRLQIQEISADFALDIRFEPELFMLHRQRNTEARVRTALDPEKALMQRKHCIILGDPGTGKTTLLKYLVMKSVNKQFTDLPDLPIYIGLHDYATRANEKADLLTFIVKIWSARYGILEDHLFSFLKRKLERGEALLLLDGLDETFVGEKSKQAKENQDYVAKLIKNFTETYSRVPVAVTVRRAFYRPDSLPQDFENGFSKLYMTGAFSIKEIRQFVDNWFASKPDLYTPGYAADLNTKLAQNIRLQTLASNPLILSLIVSTYADAPELPTHRAIIYQQSVNTLLSRWDATRDIHRFSSITLAQRQALFQKVAWKLQNDKTYYIREDALYQLFTELIGRLPKKIEAFEEFNSQNTLLVKQENDYFCFLHPTFQQYFATQYCVEQGTIEDLLTYKFDPWWEETILLYSAYADISPLIWELLKPERKDQKEEELFHTSLMLAGRCLATAPAPWKNDLALQITEPLFSLLLQTPYQLTRMQATMTLAEIGGDEVNYRLLDLLTQEQHSMHVLSCITKALGTVGERSVADELLNLLANPTLSITLRKQIADALGSLGERSVITTLLQLLSAQNIDQTLRWHITIALIRLGEHKSEVTSALQQMLPPANPTSLRNTSATPSSEIEERENSLHALITHRQLAEDVRWSFIVSLGTRNEAADIGTRLYNQFTDTNLGVSLRNCIATSLGTEPALDVLRQLLLEEDFSFNDINAFVSSIGEWGLEGLACTLVPLLQDQKINSVVRQSIAAAIGALDDRTVTKDLCALLPQQAIPSNIRRAIATTLGILGDVSIIMELLSFLGDESIDVSVRSSIALASGKLSYSDDKLIGHSLYKVRAKEEVESELYHSITITLGKLGDKTDWEKLLGWFVNPQIEQEERNEITYALYMQEKSDIVKWLMNWLINQLNTTEPLPKAICKGVLDVIEHLADSKETIEMLVELMNSLTPSDTIGEQTEESDEVVSIINSLHHALWQISRRIDNVYIFKDKKTGSIHTKSVTAIEATIKI